MSDEPRGDTFGLTHAGKVRRLNEDQFLIASLQKTMTLRHTSLDDLAAFTPLERAGADLLLIADGVGGVPGGEQASRQAVATVARFLTYTAGCYYNADVDEEHEFLQQLERAVHRAHAEIVADRGAAPGPATTLTLVQLIWPRAYLVHIGDSRCYYLRNGVLKQLTRDQTLGEDVLDQGLLSEAEVERRGLDHVLTSAIGAEITPSIGLIDLEPGDVLLLCTDGLNKHVPDAAIRDILHEGGSARRCCERLVAAALAAGGSDNVTVVVSKQ